MPCEAPSTSSYLAAGRATDPRRTTLSGGGKGARPEAQYMRLKARRGPKKAVIAVAASILKTAYHMLADGTCYQDLGADYFARRDPGRVVAKLASRIRSLGYHVEVKVAEVAA